MGLFFISFSSFFYENIQGIRIAGEKTNTLHIFSLEKEDNGEYSCSAMNSEGESMSPHLNLSIECEYAAVTHENTENTLYDPLSMQ